MPIGPYITLPLTISGLLRPEQIVLLCGAWHADMDPDLHRPSFGSIANVVPEHRNNVFMKMGGLLENGIAQDWLRTQPNLSEQEKRLVSEPAAVSAEQGIALRDAVLRRAFPDQAIGRDPANRKFGEPPVYAVMSEAGP